MVVHVAKKKLSVVYYDSSNLEDLLCFPTKAALCGFFPDRENYGYFIWLTELPLTFDLKRTAL